MTTLDKFQGHIVLYCKGQYKIPEGEKGFFEGLKMIWSIRCVCDYEHTSSDTLTYIANDMYKIIAEAMHQRLPYLMEILHREVNPNRAMFKPEGLNAIEAIVWEYSCMLSDMQVREIAEGKKRYHWLVKLPKRQTRLFNKILSGRGEHSDYYLVK